MKKIITTLILSAITATAFVFFFRSGLLSKVPGFRCEGAGCSGLGFVYLFLALVIIPLAFGAGGYYFSRESRLKQTFFSVTISLVLMVLSLVSIVVWDQIEIQRASKEEERMMRELYQRLNIPDHPMFQEKSLFKEPSR